MTDDVDPGIDYQGQLRDLTDTILDLLDRAAAAGVELDPLATIIQSLKDRGTELDTADMPPMLKMLLAGMLEQ